MACSPARIARFSTLARQLTNPLFGALAVVAILIAVPIISAGPASSASASVALVSQTDWVRGTAPMTVGVAIRSTQSPADLGLKFTVYSRLTSRYAFGLSETGNEPSSELVLGSTPIIPIDGLSITPGTPDGVAVNIRFVTAATPSSSSIAAPELALDCPPGSCDGVYPLEVVVVDRSTDKPLASLTTHLIYLAGRPGLTPLKVALVLPLGKAPAMTPGGNPTLSPDEIGSLGDVLHVVDTHQRVPLTIDAYPQLLLALERSPLHEARTELAVLRALAARPTSSELLDAPFANVSPTSLADAGLQSDFTAQLSTGQAALHSLLGFDPTGRTFVSFGSLDDAALTLLAKSGIAQAILPVANVSTSSTTITAPFKVQPSSGASARHGNVTAFVADSGLANHFTSAGNSVLAAHEFLADVAQIFFQAPFAGEPRGVVVVPSSLPTSEEFLNIVLGGLQSDPIAAAATISSLFASVPVGSNGAATGQRLVSSHGASASLMARAVRSARDSLDALGSVVPADPTFVSTAADSILLGEASGLSGDERSRFFKGPADAIAVVRASLSLSGTQTVTIAQHRAKIPVTIVSGFPSPLHAVLHLESGDLTLVAGQTRQAVVLARKNTPVSVTVTTRTSGVSTLGVELVSPRGGVVLIDKVFTVRSTAFSVVAVIISALALAVLAGWWFRSYARRRRRRAHERQAAAVASEG